MKRLAVVLLVLVVGFMVSVIARTDFTNPWLEAGRRERLCNHFIHLLVVLPNGQVIFPGKPGYWTNIDLYVKSEIPGVMQVVETNPGDHNNYQRLTIVERRCGG